MQKNKSYTYTRLSGSYKDTQQTLQAYIYHTHHPINAYHRISSQIIAYHRISSHIIAYHRTTPHNIAQHRTTPHNTAQHRTTLHNIAQHYTTSHNTTQHRTTSHNIAQYRTIPHNTAQPSKSFDRSSISLSGSTSCSIVAQLKQLTWTWCFF